MKRTLKAIGKRLRFLWSGTDGLEAILAETSKMLDRAFDDLRVVRQQRDRHLAVANRLRAGLDNIHKHAAGGLILPFSPDVLRDYCREVLDNTLAKLRQANTEGVSAAQRWGYDFTKPPGYVAPTQRRKTN